MDLLASSIWDSSTDQESECAREYVSWEEWCVPLEDNEIPLLDVMLLCVFENNSWGTEAVFIIRMIQMSWKTEMNATLDLLIGRTSMRTQERRVFVSSQHGMDEAVTAQRINKEGRLSSHDKHLKFQNEARTKMHLETVVVWFLNSEVIFLGHFVSHAHALSKKLLAPGVGKSFSKHHCPN